MPTYFTRYLHTLGAARGRQDSRPANWDTETCIVPRGVSESIRSTVPEQHPAEQTLAGTPAEMNDRPELRGSHGEIQSGEPHAVRVRPPLGTDVLLLQQFSGTESLSRLFRFELELLAESSTDDRVRPDPRPERHGRRSRCPDGSTRYFNGIVSRFSQGQRVSSPQGGGTFTPLSGGDGAPALDADQEVPRAGSSSSSPSPTS